MHVLPASLRLLAVGFAVAGGITALAGAAAPATNGLIAFARVDADSSQIFVIGADGAGERKVTQPPAGFRDDLPDWSPGGLRIVFERCASGGGACSIWAVRPDGTRSTRLSPQCPNATPGCVDDRSPVYSRDGRHIAFIRLTRKQVRGFTPSSLMVADAGLRNARRVVGFAVAPTKSFRGSPYGVAWSPNGKQLVFASVNEDGSRAQPAGGRALYVVDLAGTRVRRLTPWQLNAGGRPDWSVGGRILFRSNSNRLGGVGADLYTIQPNGTGLRPVTPLGDSDRVLGASYSPDGASIAFSATAEATDDSVPSISVMRAAGTDVKVVTAAQSWDTSPDWGPRAP